MTYPNGRIEHYGYDNNALDNAIGRVDYLADDNGSGDVGSHLVDYQYLGVSTVVDQSSADGVDLTYMQQSGDTLAGNDGGDEVVGLDRFGRVVAQNYVDTATGVSTDRFQYGYDADGNVLYKDNLLSPSDSELYHANSTTSGDDNAAYDSLNRLISFQRGTLSSSGNNGAGLDTVATPNTNADSTQDWSLDAVGNQSAVTTDGTTTDRTTNSQNELTGDGASALTYDNDGNTTTDENGNTLVYDAWNRLVSVTDPASVVLATYTYDATGRQITQTEAGGTTNLYYSNQWQVLEEQQSGTTTNQYVWSPFYVNQMVLRDDNSTSGNLGISGSGLGRRLFVQQDANYNVTALVNASGAVEERFIYDAYGNATVLNAGWNSSNAAPGEDLYNWVYLEQGGRYDAAIDLYIFHNRDYSAITSTWIEQDPSGYADSLDAYQSLNGNPLFGTDPNGTGEVKKIEAGAKKELGAITEEIKNALAEVAKQAGTFTTDGSVDIPIYEGVYLEFDATATVVHCCVNKSAPQKEYANIATIELSAKLLGGIKANAPARGKFKFKPNPAAGGEANANIKPDDVPGCPPIKDKWDKDLILCLTVDGGIGMKLGAEAKGEIAIPLDNAWDAKKISTSWELNFKNVKKGVEATVGGGLKITRSYKLDTSSTQP